LNKENGKKKFTSKSIFIVWLVGFSILLVGFLIPMVNADHDTVEKSLDDGLNEIFFRDISNTNPQTSSLDVDSSTSNAGFVTVTVSDPDANLDLDDIDAVTAFAGVISLSGLTRTTPINLPESGFNSGIFTSTVDLVLSSATGNQVEVNFGDTLSFSYLPEPDHVGRLFAEINVPNKMSLSLLPSRRSFPANPTRMSSPDLPFKLSTPAVPSSMSSPGVPTRIIACTHTAGIIKSDTMANIAILVVIDFTFILISISLSIFCCQSLL